MENPSSLFYSKKAIADESYTSGSANSAAEAVQFVTYNIYSASCGMRTESTKITILHTNSFPNQGEEHSI